MSRILVFCGNRAAIERFDMLPDWTVIVGLYSATQRKEMLESFRADPEAKLAVDRSMILGWRAPMGTIVLFDSSWPYPHHSAETFQACGRVEYAPPGSGRR